MSKLTFWDLLDQLVNDSQIIIEIKKGMNPVDTKAVFPVDYGYLEGTSSQDGEGIDVFVGSDPTQKVDAILCTFDLIKRDSEIKILIGCTEDEKKEIFCFYENYLPMRSILVQR